MTRTACAVLLVLSLVSCSTAPPPSPGPPSLATASIRTISPDPAAAVRGTTVIEAELEYTISNFHSESDYYIAPLFESTEGPGRTFNEFERLTDGWKLTAASGVVHIKYPIAREWRNPSLAKPVRLSFKVMVRTGPHMTKVIGESATVQFGSAVPH